MSVVQDIKFENCWRKIKGKKLKEDDIFEYSKYV